MSLITTNESGGILTVTLNEPDRRNPLSNEMRIEVMDAVSPLPSTVRTILFTGAGGMFSAGGDLSTMPPGDIAAAEARLTIVGEFITLITRLPVPTIAAVESAVAGASVGLTSACDVVVAGRSTLFHFPFTRLGLLPDGGLLSVLPARVGLTRAKRILLAGAPVDATDALDCGLIDHLVDDGESLNASHAIANDLAQRAPQAVKAIKETLANGTPTLANALNSEFQVQPKLFYTADFREGKAAFFDKRTPRFSGR